MLHSKKPSVGNKADLTIRKATIEDLPQLLEVARIAFVQAFTAGNKPENVAIYLDEAFTEKQLGEELKVESSEFYLAFLGEEMVGYLKVNFVPSQTDIHDPESIEISRLYLLDEYLGRGIGKKLLDYAIDLGRSNEKKYLWLGVWERNERAIRFYQKNGLVKFGDHPFPFGDELQTDWLMRIDL